MSTTTTIDGQTYFCQTFADVKSLNIIFNNGRGAQTADITDITEEAFFKYDGGSGYTKLDGVSAINGVYAFDNAAPSIVYNLKGQRVATLPTTNNVSDILAPGIYIIKGKKIIVK